MNEIEPIYRAYFQDIHRYLLGLTRNPSLAEELTSETFFRAMRSLDRFRGECEVRVWLCGIAKNCWISHGRRGSRLSEDEDVLETVADRDDWVGRMIDRDMARQVHRVLHDMDEPYKEVFSLRVFGELPFRQIGELFGRSEHWACVTYHRARERMKKGMGGEEA